MLLKRCHQSILCDMIIMGGISTIKVIHFGNMLLSLPSVAHKTTPARAINFPYCNRQNENLFFSHDVQKSAASESEPRCQLKQSAECSSTSRRTRSSEKITTYNKNCLRPDPRNDFFLHLNNTSKKRLITLSVFVLPPRNFPVFVRKVLPDSNKKTQKVKSFTHSLDTETSSFDICDNAIMIIFQNSVQEMKISLQQLSNPNFSRGGSRPNSSPTPAVNGIGKTFHIFILNQEKLDNQIYLCFEIISSQSLLCRCTTFVE